MLLRLRTWLDISLLYTVFVAKGQTLVMVPILSKDSKYI